MAEVMMNPKLISTFQRTLPSGSVRRYGKFICECGAEFSADMTAVKRGKIKSCGCLRNRLSSERMTTHGLTKGGKPPEYHIWRGMKDRCQNPNSKRFADYGGRGIQVCQRWSDSFAAFLSDVGRRPFDGASIDRIDNNKGYEPGNVRWTDDITQSTNRRHVNLIEHDGALVSLKTYCRLNGLTYGTVITRVSRDGWPVSEAIKPGDSFRFRKNGSANIRKIQARV